MNKLDLVFSISHRKLCEAGGKWLMRTPNYKISCPFVCVELVCAGGVENPDILGLRQRGSILIEVKVSRSDFKADFKKPSRQPGNPHAMGAQRYYMAPKGMIDVSEVPKKWGLIEYDGSKFEVQKYSEPFEECRDALNATYLSILRREVGYKLFDYRNKS